MTVESKNDGAVALVTGATGLLGSHIVEQLRLRDRPIRALCRLGSDTAFLKSIGAEIVVGDVTDGASLRRACTGAGRVYHAVARVDDWGPWEAFERVTIGGTRNMLDAAHDAGVERFVHISSSSVYGHVSAGAETIDESSPLGVHLPKSCCYARSKIEAEKLVRRAHDEGLMAATIIRPCWLYGPRDRASMPRLVDAIYRRRLRLIGRGDNRMNIVHAANVADAAILAGQSERAIGEVYNCSYDGVLTQRQYFNMIAKALGEPEITTKVPYVIAHTAAHLLESVCRVLHTKRPPFVTRHSIYLMGRRCFYECQKIKDHLGWSPCISYEEGIPAAVKDAVQRAYGAPRSRSSREDLASSAVP